MKTRPKPCDGCGKTFPIWKNHEGKKYCRFCASKLSAKRSKPAPISHRQKELLKEYSSRRAAFLSLPRNRNCKAKLPGCTGLNPETLTIHHSRGRGQYMLDESTWITLCGNCHQWVEDHPGEAQKMGLSFHRLETTESTT